ncbi:hypothetical protein [Zavarzinella formosa]|uniref:hypothetical protein n=1 Tax=Zavarzinella formosa TaxID=360055 RepID=UPI0002DAF660|nr:hypothetical protein [Zavarzinella formosa]
MELLCLGFFLLSFAVSVVFLVVMAGRFLSSIHRTVKLVSPEHRQLSPGFVWYLLIPGVGFFLAVWMVCAVAASLRYQFESIKEQQPEDSYGLVAGLIWAYSLLAFVLVTGLALSINLSSLSTLPINALCLTIYAFFVSAFIGWIAYREQIREYKSRLEKHSATGRIIVRTQEELDYGDDIGERKPEDDGRS